MSHTVHNTKGPGYEYWSRRPGKWYEIGRKAKKFTHKVERRLAKKELKRDMPC